MYSYAAQALRLVDGDTLDMNVDLGFRVFTVQRIRLLGIDCPERGTPGYADATAFVALWLQGRGTVLLQTDKADSFGRWLGTITDIRSGEGLAAALLAGGHAQLWNK